MSWQNWWNFWRGETNMFVDRNWVGHEPVVVDYSINVGETIEPTFIKIGETIEPTFVSASDEVVS